MSMFSANLNNIEYSFKSWPIATLPLDYNITYNYIFLDSEEQFQQNCANLPENWRFRELHYTYKFNNTGQRMEKKLDDVNYDYILFLGCSHTVGVGLPLHETYPYLTATELGLDYINGGAPGASVKFTFLNLFYALQYLPKPKYVVISWPSYGRYVLFRKKAEFILPNFEIKTKHTENLYNAMITEDFLTQEASLFRTLSIDLCSKLKIPLIEFTFFNNDNYVRDNNIHIVDSEDTDLNTYYARDILKVNGSYISHPGSALHRSATDYIKDSI